MLACFWMVVVLLFLSRAVVAKTSIELVMPKRFFLVFLSLSFVVVWVVKVDGFDIELVGDGIGNGFSGIPFPRAVNAFADVELLIGERELYVEDFSVVLWLSP